MITGRPSPRSTSFSATRTACLVNPWNRPSAISVFTEIADGQSDCFVLLDSVVCTGGGGKKVGIARQIYRDEKIVTEVVTDRIEP